MKLTKGSICSVYSISKWCTGLVIDSHSDATGEWLTIEYNDEEYNLCTCKIRRHSCFLKYISHNKVKPKILLSIGCKPEWNQFYPWIPLRDIPNISSMGDIIKISPSKILLFENIEHDQINGIQIFDHHTLKWKLFCEYDETIIMIDEITFGRVRVIYNEQSDKLYLFYRNTSSETYHISIASNFLSTEKPRMSELHENCGAAELLSYDTLIVNDKDNLHLIKDFEHVVLTPVPYQVNLKTNVRRLPFNNTPLFSVFVPSRNIILVMVSLGISLSIFQYSFDGGGLGLWTRLDSNVDDILSEYSEDDLTAVLTKDEKHIIFARKTFDHETYFDTSLWIMDINFVEINEGSVVLFQFRQSSIDLPMFAIENSIKMTRILMITNVDERTYNCMLIGFLRDMNVLIPMEIVDMILYFYGERQWLHALYFAENKDKNRWNMHYVIEMEDIHSID